MEESKVLKRELDALLADVCEFLGSFQLTSWLAMGAATTAFCSVLILSNFAVEVSFGRFIDGLYDATGGWIAPQLVYPSCALGLMGLALRIDGRSLADVGWRTSALIPAVMVVALFWLCTQGSLWLVNVLGPEATSGRWRGHGGAALAGLNAQLLGNSLAEETLFRGFLLPQVYLRAARVSSKNVALIAGLLAPLTLSVLIHIPRLVYEEGIVGVDLAEPLFWSFRFGLTLAVVFLVTRNLFLCVGLHAVWNARPTLIEAPWQYLEMAWWVWTGLLVIGWTLRRKSGAERA